MIILGLDPGIGTMGYGVIEKDARGNCTAVDYGVVRTPPGENLAVRLCILEDGVNALFDKFRPEEAGVDQVFTAKNIASTIKLAQARGAAISACASRAISGTFHTRAKESLSAQNFHPSFHFCLFIFLSLSMLSWINLIALEEELGISNRSTPALIAFS